MPKSNANLALKGLDEMFSTEESRQEQKREQVQQIPIDALHPFTNHPFKVLDDEAMQRTVESVAQYGVLAPLIARPRPEGGYEIISGHRRQYAAKLAGLETLPVIVRNMDDNAAVLLMVDSNLQREHIPPSERAFAYKMKLDAMKRTSGRPSKENVSPIGTQKRSDQIMAEELGESRNQIQRFIRLTNAVPAVKTPRPEAKSTSTGAMRSVKPKRTERPSATQKASAAQSGAKSVSVPTAAGHSASEADAEKHSERSEPKPEPKQKHAAQQPEAKEVHQKSAQQLEAERQQKLENLRATMQKQICTIHADVELPAGKLNDSEAAEQKLHILLYKSTLPENDLNQTLDELRTERRRQKAEYQGAPFADVFLVNLILSDEDSERPCIVDVGDTGMSYVIPWSSIPKDLQESMHRYVSEVEGKLCGYCKEELCNSESGRMVVELYLGRQDGHSSRILY